MSPEDPKAQLVESLAREHAMRSACVKLKESLGEYVRQSMYFNPEWSSGLKAVDAALDLPLDDTALREFGLMVAIERDRAHNDTAHETVVESVMTGKDLP